MIYFSFIVAVLGQPDAATLRLPANVQATAKATIASIPIRRTVHETIDSVSLQNEWFEAGLWIPQDIHFSDRSEAISYYVPTRRARRTSRQAVNGSTVADGMVTPLAYVRWIDFAKSQGAEIRVETDIAGLSTVHLPPLGNARFRTELLIDTQRQTLTEVRLIGGTPEKIARRLFSDYIELGDGTHLPRKIIVENPPLKAGADPAIEVWTISDVVVKTSQPERPKLSAQTVIEDQIAGTLTRVDGQPLDPLPLGSDPAGTVASRSVTWLLVGVGLTLLGVAAWIWRVRTR